MSAAGQPEEFGGTDLQSRRRFLGAVAQDLDARLPEIARAMRDLLTGSIGELNSDPQMVEMLQASIEGNVATICHVLANDIPIDKLQPTTAAVEYAARLAQRDVPVSALTRAYYLGQSMFLRLGIDAVEQLPVRDEVRIELIRALADVVHRYIDWILQYVFEVHELERRRWWNARATMNAAAVTRLLRGDDQSGRSFESETGYRLDQPHLAVVIWSDVDRGDVEQQHIEHLIRRVAAALGSATPPLLAAADRSTAWAWIASPRSPVSYETIAAATADSPHIRISVGELRDGIDGFRFTHEQAVNAQMVALTSAPHSAARVVPYQDPSVALLAVFIHDLPATRRWVRGVLGELAEPGELAEVTRRTLAEYYANRENVVRTAAALGLHRNTVRHRIDRYEATTAFPIDPLQGALALRLFDAFGVD
ncbi:PucR family transcriptional regulator [Agromyces bauzanensis]